MSDAESHVHHAIDYLEIYVTDMAAAQRFYGAAFGWTFTDYAPTYAGIRGGEREMGGLCVRDAVTPGGSLIVLFSKDLDTTLAAVREAGGEVVKEPYAFPGGRRFHFADPSGNELAVWSAL
ncbi:MAG: VOC family protein [Polyangiaceae bacterium]